VTVHHPSRFNKWSSIIRDFPPTPFADSLDQRLVGRLVGRLVIRLVHHHPVTYHHSSPIVLVIHDHRDRPPSVFIRDRPD
jgi:hypothetical protein